MHDIKNEAYMAAQALLDAAGMKPGQIFVVGCSTSEVLGRRIGTSGTLETAELILQGLRRALDRRGIYLAVQCCEHLNRAVVMPADCAEKYGLEPVCVVPQQHAGGSLGTVYYRSLSEPCVVESVRAHAGMDIGGTLIGMHLRPVAVPVRAEPSCIGEAHVIFARTRPKLIGGERAKYV